MNPRVQATANALYRLRKIDEAYSRYAEGYKALGESSVRHKCFISYHTADAEEVLSFVERFDDIFIPKTIGLSDDDSDIIDSYNTDYVMDRIREKYLSDSTVTIVLVGKCTWARKYVDWEVASSLRSGKVNKINGLMALRLPSIDATNGTLPARVNDNVSGEAGYARYWSYPTSGSSLRRMIEEAFEARTSKPKLIVNTRARRERNGDCS